MKSKNTLLTLLVAILFIPLSGRSQTFNSIYGTDSTKWTMPFCQLDQGDMREYIAKGDTTINTIGYIKVGTVENNTVDYSINGNVGSVNGLTRENVNTGQAWFMGAWQTTSGLDTLEFLIMDLSLSLTDTFVVYHPFGDSTISKIDSVYWMSGKKYVRTDYVLPGGEQKLTFIEGVGTNYGLNYMHDNDNLCPCLASHDLDDEAVYVNVDCSPVAGNDKQLSSTKVNIYPHPILNTGILEFEKFTNESARLVIYNLMGRVVKNYNTSTNYFDISNELNLNGVYFFRIITDQKVVGSGKINFINE